MEARIPVKILLCRGRGERGKIEEWGRKKQGRARIFFFLFFWSRSRREDRDIFARDRQTLKMLSGPWERCHPTSKIPSWLISRRKNFFIHPGFRVFQTRWHLSRKLFKIGGGKKRNARSVMKNSEHRLEISTMDSMYFSSYISFHNFVSFNTIEFTCYYIISLHEWMSHSNFCLQFSFDRTRRLFVANTTVPISSTRRAIGFVSSSFLIITR